MPRGRSPLRYAAAAFAALVLCAVIPAAPAWATTTPTADALSDAGISIGNTADDDMVDVSELLGADVDTHGSFRLRDGSSELDVPIASYAQSSHTVNVAVVSPSGSGVAPDFIADATISGLISKVGASWQTQSNNQVTSVAVGGAIQHYSSGLACGATNALASEAALKFGRTDLRDYVGTGSLHLLVLLPTECFGGSGSGLGTVGADSAGTVSASFGGIMWVALSGGADLDVLTHEFGHNLGLKHSNAHFCPAVSPSEGTYNSTSGTFTDGCYDAAYGDTYDVMGMSISGNGRANVRPTALNVTQKARLGALAAGEVAPVSLAAGTASQASSFTLASTGATSGQRALAVTDPRTGQIYYVDFRGGGGTDASSLYEAGLLRFVGTDIGVRVLTTRYPAKTNDASYGASIVLTNTAVTGTTKSTKLFLAAGEKLTTASNGIVVVVDRISGGTATVTVGLANATTTPPTTSTTPPTTPTTPPSTPAVVPTTAGRLSGDDRYSTAVKVSQAGYPGAAPVVYIATGTNYPDALAAAPAAALNGGPLLLNGGASVLPVVKAEIQRLRPQRVVVVGGPNAIPDSVVTDLRSLVGTVDRINGADRYDTARKVVADAFGSVSNAYLATAHNYPDALSAAAAAGAQGIPVLLVDGASSAVDGNTRALINQLGITKVTVVGGTAVVSPGIEASLRSAGMAVTRLGGSDRFETSRLVNAAAFGSASGMYLATGYQFPDALAGAALAGAQKAPLYVVTPGCVPGGVLDDVTRLGVSSVTLVGGPNALSDSVARLQRCP